MKSSSKKSYRLEHRDKQQIFSIRKFNVGVASVAIAAFWLANGTQVAANELGVSPETETVSIVGDLTAEAEDEEPAPFTLEEASDSAVALTTDAQEAVATPNSEEVVEAAESVSEEAPVSDDVSEEASTEVSEEVAEADTSSTEASEESEEAQVEEESSTEAADASEEATTAPADAEPAETTDVGAVVETRTATLRYKVEYIDAETGYSLYQRNYATTEETTNAEDQPLSVEISVALELDTVQALNGYSLLEEQSVTIVNNAIEAAIVEGVNKKLVVNVRRDQAAAPANGDEEGYTMLFVSNQTASMVTYDTATADSTVSETWEIVVEPTADSKKQAEETAKIYTRLPEAPTDNEGKAIVVVNEQEIVFEHDSNEDRVPFFIGYLGDPSDEWSEENATVYDARDDYNERNNTAYYIRASLGKEGNNNVYFQLVDGLTGDMVEELVIDRADRTEYSFAKLTELAPTDDFGLNYYVSVGEEQVNISARGIEERVVEGVTYNEETGYGHSNRSLYIYNSSETIRETTDVNNFTIRIPNLIEQKNSYYAVDVETYREYLSNNLSYKATKEAKGEGNESLLSRLTATGYQGNAYDMASELTYDDYERVETPKENMSVIDSLLVGDYEVGARYQFTKDSAGDETLSASRGVKRIVEITSTEGDAKIELWVLDISKLESTGVDQEIAMGYAKDYSYVSEEDLQTYFTKVYESESLSSGEFNTTWYALDLMEGDYPNLLTAAKQRINSQIADVEATLRSYKREIDISRGSIAGNNTYMTRWVMSMPGTTNKVYGSIRIPTLVSKGEVTNEEGSRSTIRIGGTYDAIFNPNTNVTQDLEFYYVEKGSVYVHFEDREGNELQDEVIVVDHGDSGSEYSTSDHAQEVIYKDDKKYYLVNYPDGDVTSSGVKRNLQEETVVNNKFVQYTDQEIGDLEAGTDKHLTYVYEEAGSVLVNYVIFDGNDTPLSGEATGIEMTSVQSTEVHTAYEDGRPGTEYTTTTLKATEIKTADGKVYRVLDSVTDLSKGAESGRILAAQTMEVTYKYEEVLGSVTVAHVSDTGEILIPATAVKTDASLNETYETQPESRIVLANGRIFDYVEHDETSAPVSGDIVEGVQRVRYIYTEVKGNVTVEHVSDTGEVLIEATAVAKDQSIGLAYATAPNTTGGKERIVLENGRTFDYVGLAEGSSEASGKVTEAPQHVTFVYKEVFGTVTVEHVTDTGDVLIETADVARDQSLGTDYVATPNEVDGKRRIVLEDGRVFDYSRRSAESAPATGKVTENPQHIVFVYTEVLGTVTVQHILDENEVLIPAADVERDASIGTPYETSAEARIVLDSGRVFVYKELATDSAAGSGKVAEEAQKVVYVYTEIKGGVTVEHVSTEGLVLSATEVVAEEAPIGTDYTTSDKGRITLEDGRIFDYKELATDSAEPTGKVAEEPQHVIYLYQEVFGTVTVEYVTNTGEVLIETADVERDASVGTPYTTSVQDEIALEDGRVFKYRSLSADSAPAEGAVRERAQHIVYVYEEILGNVTVEHISTEDEVLIAKANVKQNASLSETYETSNEERIVLSDKRVFDFKEVHADSAPVSGQVDREAQHIIYVYEEVKGTVTVEYLTESGEVIIPEADVVRDASIGTTYVTSHENRYILDDGRIFDFTEVSPTSAPFRGEVTEEDQKVVYLYHEVLGAVTVRHVSESGQILISKVDVVRDASIGTDYTTNHETRIVLSDGRIFDYKDLHKDSDPATGKVTEIEQDVIYVYSEVKGTVTVEHVSEAGEVLIETADVVRDASIGRTNYTTNNAGRIVLTDGRIFDYKEVHADSAPVSGTVTEAPQHVVYVYSEVLGNVTVEHLSDTGEVLIATAAVVSDASIGSSYATSNEERIVLADGRIFDFRRVGLDSDAPEGLVTETPKHVVFEYREVLGNVTVEHVSEAGEVLIETASVVRNASMTTPYETEPQDRIVLRDGRIFDYKALAETSAPVSGQVTETPQHVVYVYSEVLGTVTVEHVSEAGETLIATADVVRDASIGINYRTANQDRIVLEDGRIFDYKALAETSASANGTVTEAPQHVVYVYKEVLGAVTVEHISDTGLVLIATADVVRDASIGTAYETSNESRIVLDNGRIFDYKEVAANSSATSGQVTEAPKHVVYVYTEVKSGVTVEHVSEAGEVLIATAVVVTETPIGTAYETTNETRIVLEDGRIFDYKALAETSAPASGQVTEAPQHVVYVYSEVLGSVTVEHVSEAGEVLIATADVARDASIGTAYETTNETRIVLEDGRIFDYKDLAETSARATGTVAENPRHVVYVYKEVLGTVTVEHLSESGDVLIPTTDVVRAVSMATPYETTNESRIVLENGQTFDFKEVAETSSPTSGQVTEAPQHIIYVYTEVLGSVTSEYVTDTGEVLIAKETTFEDLSLGTGYEISPYARYSLEDGRIFAYQGVAEESAPASGTIIEEPQHIVFVYTEVKGGVTAEHISDKDEVLTPVQIIAEDASIGSAYEATNLGRIVLEDGRTFVYKAVSELSDPETGLVSEEVQHVIFIYTEIKGNVTVEHVADTGEVLGATEDVKYNVSLGTTYETSPVVTDGKERIVLRDGRIFDFVALAEDSAPASGQVTEDDQHVVYVYSEVLGNVTVSYVSTEGEALVPTADVISDASIGARYTTSALKNDAGKLRITTEDGRIFDYKQVAAASAPVRGRVTEADQEVIYVYEEVLGSVTAIHLSLANEVLAARADVVRDASINSAYAVSPLADETGANRVVLADGRIFEFSNLDANSAPATGVVTENEQSVIFRYQEIKGNVTVEHVTEDGEVLVAERSVRSNASIGTAYSTTSQETITTADGRIFVFKELAEDSAPATGLVTEAAQKVSFVYQEVEGLVTVEAVTESGEVLVPETVVSVGELIGTAYSTTPQATLVLTDEDGNAATYKFLSVHADSAATSGTVVIGKQKVIYVYQKVEVVESTKGNVTVYYHIVDEAGNVLVENAMTPVVDSHEEEAGTAYDTSDYRYVRITVGGKNYEWVSADGAAEQGEVEAQVNKEVHYYYKEVVTAVASYGSVLVRYHILDAEGKLVQENALTPVPDTNNELAGTAYDTSEYKLARITVSGVTYVLVEEATDGADEQGTVEGDVTKSVNYYYSLPVDEPSSDEPSTDEPSSDEPSSDEPSTDEPSSDEPSSDEPSSDEPSSDEPSTDEPSSDEPSSDEPSSDEPSSDEPSSDEPSTDEPSSDEPSTDEPSSDEPSTDEPSSDEPSSDEPSSDEPSTDEPSTDEPSSDEPSSDEPSSDEPSSDEPSSDEPSSDEPSSDEPSSDEPSSDEPSSDEPSTDEPSSDEPSSDEPSSDEPSTDEPSSDEPSSDEPSSDEPSSDEPSSDEPSTDETPSTELILPTTPLTPEALVVVGEDLPASDKTAVISAITLPTGANAEVTSPIKLDDQGQTYVDVTVTDKDGQASVVKVLVEAVVAPETAVNPANLVLAGDELADADKATVATAVTVPSGATATVTSPVKVDENGQAYVEVTVTKGDQSKVVQVPVEAIIVPTEAQRPATQVVSGNDLTDADKAAIADAVKVPTGAKAEVTSPVKVDENGQAYVEVTVTGANGQQTVVKVPVEAIIVPTESQRPATQVVAGDDLTEADKAAIADAVKVPTGAKAEVTSPVKVDENGQAYVEVTVTGADGQQTVVKVPVEAIIVPTEEQTPVTQVVAGDDLTDADKAAIADAVKVPTGAKAEVTSPVKVDENGQAYVEVTVTGADGQQTVVKVPVEAIVVPTEAQKPSSLVVSGNDLTDADKAAIAGAVKVPAGAKAEVTSPVKVDANGQAYVEVTVTGADGQQTVVKVPVEAIVTPTAEVNPSTPTLAGDNLSDADQAAVVDSITLPTGATAKVTSPVKVDANGQAYVEVTITGADGSTEVVKVPVKVTADDNSGNSGNGVNGGAGQDDKSSGQTTDKTGTTGQSDDSAKTTDANQTGGNGGNGGNVDGAATLANPTSLVESLIGKPTAGSANGQATQLPNTGDSADAALAAVGLSTLLLAAAVSHRKRETN